MSQHVTPGREAHNRPSASGVAEFILRRSTLRPTLGIVLGSASDWPQVEPAALLLKETLPTFMAEFQRSEPRAGMALALAVMLLTALIIWIGVRALRKRGMDLQAAGV